MTMREELFVDGPLAGWRTVPDGWWRSGVVHYPKRIERDVTSFGKSLPSLAPTFEDGTYTRRLYFHPSWRILLAFWVEGTQLGPMPDAAVPLPGFEVDGSSDYEGCELYDGAGSARPDWQALQAAWNELHRAWRRNDRLQQWQLSAGGEVFGTVTYEFIARVGTPKGYLARVIDERFGVPLPDEAWQ